MSDLGDLVLLVLVMLGLLVLVLLELLVLVLNTLKENIKLVIIIIISPSSIFA